MTSRDFCYWLQGVFEIGQPKSLNEEQIELIRRHLNMVFYHEIDPSFPREQQASLDSLHNGNSIFGDAPTGNNRPVMKC